MKFDEDYINSILEETSTRMPKYRKKKIYLSDYQIEVLNRFGIDFNKYNDLIEQNKQLQIELAEREIELNKQIESLSLKIEDLGDKLGAFADVMVDIDCCGIFSSLTIIVKFDLSIQDTISSWTVIEMLEFSKSSSQWFSLKTKTSSIFSLNRKDTVDIIFFAT